ncbi:MAG: uncharacterized membrane-anchored protein YitT (DUF2179 family), partial [Urechidicola sp.]
SIGKVVLCFNIILFSITAFAVSVEVALYSILTYIIAAKVTDTVIEGFEDFIGVTIVSKKHSIIKKAILEELGVGLTIYKGSSGYGYNGQIEDFDIIHSIVNRIDIKKMYGIIKVIDTDAFIVEFDVNSVKGGVLRHYIDKKKNKDLSINKSSKNTTN